jgi:hypothetical protein
MESLGTTDTVPKLDAARELVRASIERAHAGSTRSRCGGRRW